MSVTAHAPFLAALMIVGLLGCDTGYSLGATRRSTLRVGTPQLLANHFHLNSLSTVVHAEPEREWTVMMYLNGDNNLEREILSDFREAAEIGSTEEVNVVAQLDRHPGFVRDKVDDWSDTRRFFIKRGTEPSLVDAIRGFSGEVDMTKGASLTSFVGWAMQQYPARHYALIIGSHGQGWRFFAGPNSGKMTQAITAFDSAESARPDDPPVDAPAGAEIVSHPMRSITHDMTGGGKLYNRELEDALESLLAGKHLDVIGFDACLMGMLETGYAMRAIADVMVASEEIEPEEGWDYSDVLKPLVDHPTMSGEEFGASLVAAYQNAYPRNRELTLSAIRLSTLTEVADAVTSLADELKRTMEAGNSPEIIEARRGCRNYAEDQNVHSIDLRCFTDRLISRSSDGAVKAAAERVNGVVDHAVILNHTGTRKRAPAFVSAGLAIYFPGSGQELASDPESYDYRNGVPPTRFPVRFVDEHRWDEFLRAYATYRP